jgi:glycogen synthase
MAERPLHICIVSMEYPPETDRGGVGTYSAILSKALARLGHRVTVVAQGLSCACSIEQDGVTVRRVKEHNHPWAVRLGRMLDVAELAGFLVYSERVCEEIVAIDATHPIDVIEVPEWAVETVFARRSFPHIPVVVRLHTPQFLLDQINCRRVTVNRRLIHILERVHTLGADSITSISRSLADVVARRYRIDPAAIRVIATPLDVESFAVRAADRDPNLVLYSGRLEMRKGVHVLIDAMPAVVHACPDVRLVLMGGDTSTAPGGQSCRHWLLERCAGHGITPNVAFIGALERSAALDWYARAGTTVVPSLYEAFGYTCLEAMAGGSAVVASDCGGLPEIVQHGESGLLFEPGNSAQLASCLISLLIDTKRAERLRKGAIRRANSVYRDDVIAGRMVEHYRAVIAGRKAAMERVA